MAIFDSAWYAEMIERFSSNESKDVPQALDGLGVSILAGFCVLAQSIDDLAKTIKENKPDKGVK